MTAATRLVAATVGVVILVALGALASQSQRPAAQTAAPGGSVAIRAPSFLQVNKKYVFRWQPGSVEIYRVLEIRDGWVRGEIEIRDPGQKPVRMVLWLNPYEAVTIKEEP